MLGLARTSKEDFLSGTSGLKGTMEFAFGSDFQSAAAVEEMAQNGKVRIRFDGIVDVKTRWQSTSQTIQFCINTMFGIDECRRPIFIGEGAYGNARHNQFSIRDGEVSGHNFAYHGRNHSPSRRRN